MLCSQSTVRLAQLRFRRCLSRSRNWSPKRVSATFSRSADLRIEIKFKEKLHRGKVLCGNRIFNELECRRRRITDGETSKNYNSRQT